MTPSGVAQAAQLTSPLGWRLRNTLVQLTPDRVQLRQLARTPSAGDLSLTTLDRPLLQRS
jgi:hypothetical protein